MRGGLTEVARLEIDEVHLARPLRIDRLPERAATARVVAIAGVSRRDRMGPGGQGGIGGAGGAAVHEGDRATEILAIYRKLDRAGRQRTGIALGIDGHVIVVIIGRVGAIAAQLQAAVVVGTEVTIGAANLDLVVDTNFTRRIRAGSE